jgi:signal transduction histidine kinase
VSAFVDRGAADRAIGNVVRNAIRHTPPGGSVVVAVRAAPDGLGGATSEVVVSDTGSGMPEDLAARAFERFVRAPDSDGSGLGLPIARDLLDAQGGRISLSSRQGEGTTVRLSVPAAPGEGGS